MYFYENDLNEMEHLLMDHVCPDCGSMTTFELKGLGGNYRCNCCDYEGNIREDIDNQNYFWDEALCGYDEDEKSEIFDGMF